MTETLSPLHSGQPRLATEVPHVVHNPPTEPRPKTRSSLVLPVGTGPERPDERSAAKEMFGRHFRGGLIIVTYCIKTRCVRQFYQRDFVYLSGLMHTLDKYRQLSGVDQALLDDTAAQLAGCLETTLESFRGRRQQALALVAEQAAIDPPIRYPLAVRLEVPIISPSARSYMEMLAAADDAFAALEKCWLLALIDTRVRKLEEAALRQSIRLVSSVVRRCRDDMTRHVRSVWPPTGHRNAAVHVVTPARAGAGVPPPGARSGLVPDTEKTTHTPEASDLAILPVFHDMQDAA